MPVYRVRCKIVSFKAETIHALKAIFNHSSEKMVLYSFPKFNGQGIDQLKKCIKSNKKKKNEDK